MCIFRSRNPKCQGYPSILNKRRRYPLFSALLRSKFGSLSNLSHGCLKQQCHPTPRKLANQSSPVITITSEGDNAFAIKSESLVTTSVLK